VNKFHSLFLLLRTRYILHNNAIQSQLRDIRSNHIEQKSLQHINSYLPVERRSDMWKFAVFHSVHTTNNNAKTITNDALIRIAFYRQYQTIIVAGSIVTMRKS